MPRAPQKVANTIARLSETFGDKRLASITLRDLEQYKTKRLEHVKIATVNRELFLLRAMLNTAVRRKYIEVSPFVYAQPGQPIDVEAEDSRDITVAYCAGSAQFVKNCGKICGTSWTSAMLLLYKPNGSKLPVKQYRSIFRSTAW